MLSNEQVAYGSATLPRGVRSRFLQDVNGLTMHALEAGHADPERPCVVLLHGFPELAYSWRRQLLPLVEAGYHVVAPDQRGYGRTTGWAPDYDGDLAPFRILNLVTDILALIYALGRTSVAAIVGHDWGSVIAGHCALIRPDVFRSLVLLGPFVPPRPLPLRAIGDDEDEPAGSPVDIHGALAALSPPRQHYTAYYATREANENMWRCPQGVHAFMRAYAQMKSGDWPGNRPFPLAAWTADELARLPRYYVMDRGKGMAETVAPHMPTNGAVAACEWLTEDDLRVYSTEYARTGFQGGLNWYRCRYSGHNADLRVFSRRTIDVPTTLVYGERDWGARQSPGALERMPEVCSRLLGIHQVEGAGHWVQQERPEDVTSQLLGHLGKVATE